jgi:DNA-directed RNA polymerase subunit RPC12/RpoP
MNFDWEYKMNQKYTCKDCNETFEQITEDNNCPNCKSSNIEKIIPVFFGMNPPISNDSCEGGVCSFDKNKS